MPTFFVWSKDHDKEDSFWVYAIDDWDARQQVTSTLGIDAHDETVYGCDEDGRLMPPLNVIIHGTGERTEVPEPAPLRSRQHAGCGEIC